MNTPFCPIDRRTLIAVLRASPSQRVHAYAQENGWRLVVRNRKSEWTLVDSAKNVRVFSSLGVFEDYLYEIAVPNFLVDTTLLDPSSSDPNIQEKLREASAAAERDEWVRMKVQESLDDPGPLIAGAVVEERAAARRAELLARLAQEKS